MPAVSARCHAHIVVLLSSLCCNACGIKSRREVNISCSFSPDIPASCEPVGKHTVWAVPAEEYAAAVDSSATSITSILVSLVVRCDVFKLSVHDSRGGAGIAEYNERYYTRLSIVKLLQCNTACSFQIIAIHLVPLILPSVFFLSWQM